MFSQLLLQNESEDDNSLIELELYIHLLSKLKEKCIQKIVFSNLFRKIYQFIESDSIFKL